jgi:NHL repeat
VNEEKLYTADSESSAIRSVDLNGRARVDTVAGGGLFEFGDRDGPGLQARFQYPMGIAYSEGALYVADTYNNKIRRIVTADGVATTVAGTGAAGLKNGGEAEFREPSGLSVADGKLYVADRGNNAIRVADLRTGEVTTLELRPDLVRAPVSPAFAGRVVELPPQSVGAGSIVMAISLAPSAARALEAAAENEVAVRVEGDVAAKGKPFERTVTSPQFPLRVTLRLLPGQGKVSAEVRLHYRRQDGPGRPAAIRIVVPVTVDKAFRARTVRVTVPGPE